MDTTGYQRKVYVERVLIAVGIALMTYLLYQLFFYIFDIILLIFAAALLAIFLRGLADLVCRYLKINETWAVLLVSVVLIGIIALAVVLLAPSVGEQFGLLRDKLPNSVDKAREFISHYGWGRTLLEQVPGTEELNTRIKNLDVSTILTRVGGYFSSTVGALGNFFITLLLAIYLASEPRFYASGLSKLFPVGRRQRVFEILAQIGKTLRWWLIGKAASMLFIGVLTWIGLSILGVPLALTLGLIAGLLSFIPNFGPILSAVPAILLAFIDSPISALYVLGLFVGVQLIESNVVTPLIERETVELPPALTIIFQLALSVLIGGLGLVLATPLLAVVMVLVQMLYVEDVLGDKIIEVNEKQGEAEVEEKGEKLKEKTEEENRL